MRVTFKMTDSAYFGH